MRLLLADAIRATGGDLLNAEPQTVATGAAIHSGKVKRGDLFFALKGTKADAHDFVGDAIKNGACAAVVARNVGGSLPMIVVPAPAKALISLAGWVRDSIDPLVVGITGSTGKTGVKDLLYSITRRSMKTVSSPGSFNNELGVPLTLLSARSDTELVVCEMGTRGPGQIKQICEYARPHVGVVTGVGTAHFEQFGSSKAIYEAKSELVKALPVTGTAILNGDDPLTRAMAAETGAQVVLYGIDQPAAVAARDVRFDTMDRPAFALVSGRSAMSIKMELSGRHQVMNALAAASAAIALGLDLDQCRHGLEAAKPSPWRMQVQVLSGVVLVNDAYNANPDSMTAALTSCSKMKGAHSQLIAVLGPMAELGAISDGEHHRIGALAAQTATRLIVVGSQAEQIAAGARSSGMTSVATASDRTAVVEMLEDLHPGDVVLVKGSRVAGLETVIPQIKAKIAQDLAS